MKLLLLACLAVPVSAAVALFRAGAPQEAAEDPLEGLSWLAGSWGATDSGTEREEHWLAPKGGLMLGMHRDHTPARGRTAFEYLRIEARAEGIYLVANPGGRPQTTAFRLAVSEAGLVAFENPEHDFPQRIEYVLEDGELAVRVEGMVAVPGNEREEPHALEWRWKRLPAGLGGAR